MEPRSEPANTAWPFPFTPQDWAQTPPAVQAYLRTVHDELGQLHKRVEALEARLKQNPRTSSQPPSAGGSTVNRGHEHQRSIKCCSARAGRPRRFGGTQRDSGT